MIKKIILFVALCYSQFAAFSQKKQYFEYPFKQSDYKWNIYKNVQERLNALQIPESTIHAIPTIDLLEICLDFPYLLDITFAENIDEGIYMLQHKFNGFKELFAREDLADAIINKLSKKEYELKEIASYDVFKKISFSIKVLFVDIASEYLRINNICTQEQFNLIDSLMSRSNQIITDYPDVFGSIYINGRRNLIPRFNSLGEKQSFLRSNDGWSEVDAYTPNGSKLKYTYVWNLTDPSYDNNDISYYSNYLSNTFSGALLVEMPTNRYNCHGYAWHVSEGGDDVWIGLRRYESDNPDSVIQAENVYWEDGSYLEVPEAIATHISYDEETANHSAIKYDSTRYISKWGSGCLVIHLPNEVPYNTSQPKKYYIRNNFSISGSTVICDSTLYSIENLPNTLNVSWSIDNSRFTLFPNGTQCTVTYNDTPQYDQAMLTATIMKDTLTVTSLSKRIVMHGTDMYLEGVQAGIYDENGDMPAVATTFTIPANNGLRGMNSRLSTLNRDSLKMTSLPVVFENVRTTTIPDNPTYGITEIYGGADIYLDSERLDGMTICFSGDRAPEYLSTDGGTMISFSMPEVSSITDVLGYYYVVLHATSEGGCHDFDLYFKVIPVEGEATGDSEISLYFTDSSVRVDFDGMEWEELPNGMLQPTPWYLRIFRMSNGSQMHYSVNTTDSKTVDISSWPADVYIVRVDSGENIYTKKFLKR